MPSVAQLGAMYNTGANALPSVPWAAGFIFWLLLFAVEKATVAHTALHRIYPCKTTIVEMMVTRELGDPFRRDALALPMRQLAKYKAIAVRRD